MLVYTVLVGVGNNIGFGAFDDIAGVEEVVDIVAGEAGIAVGEADIAAAAAEVVCIVVEVGMAAGNNLVEDLSVRGRCLNYLGHGSSYCHLLGIGLAAMLLLTFC